MTAHNPMDPHNPALKSDPELQAFLEEYQSTNGRMYQNYDGQDECPNRHLPPIRPKYYGRKPDNDLAAKRAQCAITQRELADRVGTTRRTITEIESRRQTPSVYLAIAIAQALEMQVEDIFCLPPLMPVPPSKY